MKKYLLTMQLMLAPFANGMIVKDSLCTPDYNSLVQFDDLKSLVGM